ncbi:uncharacterized protein LOC125194555 [Salvia hispanica]|uniref:uncharacterized protein LOC125194555 n=1 Tax=Salvia hispanica TaxID=49212 RepID=UPI0020097059|nr:uncharacterized protein LOC125194555 [Salvia hispanica]
MHGSVHGFPVMLDNIDCMHWEWKNCPTALKGMSNNDINILQSSPLFNDQCNGVGPSISFVANDNQHDKRYYLVDEIYPNWSVFVKTIKHPLGQKKTYFASREEAARKDVERTFGVLQSRWAVVKGLNGRRQWYIPNIGDVMYACIIMHNMIVENEAAELTQWTNEDDTGAGPSHGVATANVNMGVPHGEVERMRAFTDMRQTNAHVRLQHDIIEEVWTRRGGR